MEKAVHLNVNGAKQTVTLDPETPLLFALRNDLSLKGAKLGCGLEQCHACAVLIDGTAVPSCKIPIKQVEELPITTLEGLGAPDSLHPLQEAFIDQQAVQCGYCVNGMIMGAEGLLRRERYPSDEQIKEALERNLCRCGVYDRVRRAIHLRTGRELPRQYQVVQDDLTTQNRSVESQVSELRSLAINPDLDSWIRIDETNTVTIMTGKVEIGQGLKTAVAQIAADELNVAFEQVNVIDADTRITPNEGITAGSMSMETTGRAIRQAAADARHVLLKLAFEELEAETPAEALQVTGGVISDPATGRTTDYWQLHGGRPFGVAVSGVGKPKSPEDYAVIGQPLERTDLLGKVTGTFEYIQDLDLPNMVHARVVRPPGPGGPLKSVDKSAVESMAGVLKVVQDGSFLGVICEREEQAVWAAEKLRESAKWDRADLPDEHRLYEHMQASKPIDFKVVDGKGVEGSVPKKRPDTGSITPAIYTRPFQMHGSLGPSAAVAHWSNDNPDGHQAMTLWVQTQGVFPQQATIAPVLGIEPDALTVIHMEGSGCYGHNGADDAALDAAMLAKAFPDRPVMLKWTREDEHGREPYTSAMVVEMAADLDEQGNIAKWHHDIWSYTHLNRPMPGAETSSLLAAGEKKDPFPKPAEVPRFHPHIGEYRNADPLYAFKDRQIVSHFLPASPLRTSSLRTLGGFTNIFAIESYLDELAYEAGVDPVEYRLRHMENRRARAVIKMAAEMSGWEPQTKPSLNGKGRGFAFNQYKNIQSYVAMVVDVTVDQDSGKIRLEKALMAVDSGEVINPDGLANQMEGGFLQAASWALCEQVRFDGSQVTSLDWDSYPILRFPDAPIIETVILDRPGYRFMGAGEASSGPVPAAIANAVFDATGKRLRNIPLSL